MKIRILTSLAFIAFCHCQMFGQYYFHQFPVSGEVVSVEEKKETKGWFKPKVKVVSVYENGKIKSTQEFAGKKKVNEVIYEYNSADRKVTIKEKKENQDLKTKNINYFDDKDRLVKSEYYDLDRVQTPILIQDDFIYNEKDKVLSYKRTNIPLDGPSSSYDDAQKIITNFEIEYLSEHQSKEIGSASFPNGRLQESMIEYDPSRNSAVCTSSNYYLIKKNGERPIYFRKGDWIEESLVEVNGEKILVHQSIVKHKYVFDKQGNPVEIYKLNQKGEAQLLATRTIEYK